MFRSKQRFVDNSISKTINFPEGTTEKEVEKAYLMSWELGCKGITVYVTGSRQEVVLETKETKDKKEGKVDVSQPEEAESKRPRPDIVSGRTHKLKTAYGNVYVTVNRNSDSHDKPFEVFVTIGKSGSDVSATAEALGRLISGWLRSSKDPNAALEEIVDELKGIGGASSLGFGMNRVKSLPDGIAKILQKELALSNDTEVSVEESAPQLTTTTAEVKETKEEVMDSSLKNASVCQECGNMTLLEVEGCQKCISCGYSKC